MQVTLVSGGEVEPNCSNLLAVFYVIVSRLVDRIKLIGRKRCTFAVDRARSIVVAIAFCCCVFQGLTEPVKYFSLSVFSSQKITVLRFLKFFEVVKRILVPVAARYGRRP